MLEQQQAAGFDVVRAAVSNKLKATDVKKIGVSFPFKYYLNLKLHINNIHI
jgi:hypothetical protein